MMRLVAFDEWTGRGRWWPTRKRQPAPAAAVVVHHSVTHVAGDPVEDARTVETVIWQRRWKSRFSMVAYGWLIHPNGTVFEGRGARWRNGANRNTRGGPLNNSNTVSICFIGNYHPPQMSPIPRRPTDAQLDAAAELITQLDADGVIDDPQQIVPHRHLHTTACCGDLLADQIPEMKRRVENVALIERGDMPYVIKLPDGRHEVVLPGKGRTVVNDPTHWAQRCVEAARTGVFSSTAMVHLLDDQRHTTAVEEFGGVIEPFESDVTAALNGVRAAVAETLTAAQTAAAGTVDADAVADQVVARIRQIWAGRP